MDFEIPSELQPLLGSVRRFIEREVRPLEEAYREVEEVPKEVRDLLRRKSKEAGFWAIDMPAEVGGQGLPPLGWVLLKEEIARTAGPFHSYVLGGPGAPPRILLECNPEQRERYLLPCMRAERTCCFALTEPGAGSDAASIQTTARAEGDGFVLNGRKHFITFGWEADFAIVYAVTDKAKRGRGGITSFLVDQGTPGFSVGKIQKTMGGHDTQCELLFEDCRVPRAQVLGEVGRGFELAKQWLGWGRLGLGANAVGIAERLLTLSTSYARQRVQFGRPIAENQAIQWMLADSAVEIEAARWMVYHAAWRADRGEPFMVEASMAKLYGSEMLSRVVDRALQIHGGMGTMREFPIERVYRTSRAMRIVEGTSEIQRSIIARALLKEESAGPA